MDKMDFKKNMDRLTVIFEVESRASDDMEILYDAYFEALKHNDPIIFEKAVFLLTEVHPTKKMPTILDISGAISDVKKDMPREQHYGDECPKCSGMGMFIDNADGLAKVCACPVGKIRKVNLVSWDKMHKYFKDPKRFSRG